MVASRLSGPESQTMRFLLPLLLAVAVALLSASCSIGERPRSAEGDLSSAVAESTIDLGSEPVRASAETSPSTTFVEAEPPPPIVVGSWETDEFGTLASDFVSCGEVVLFETLTGDRGLEIVAIDASTGEEKYRIEIDRGSILPGQAGRVVRACKREMFFGLSTEHRFVAYDITSGEQLWSTSTEVDKVSVCGDFLCGSLRRDRSELRFDLDDGQLVSASSLPDDRVIYSDGNGFRLVPIGDSLTSGPTALAGYFDLGRVWITPVSDITDISGHTFSPTRGWRSFESGDENVVVQYLGGTFDESKTAAEQEHSGGVLFAIRKDTGEVLWAHGNLLHCADDAPLFCHVSGSTKEFYDLDKLIRIDPSTGKILWEHDETRYPFARLEGTAFMVPFYENYELADQYYIDDATGEVLSSSPASYGLCSTFDQFDEDTPDDDYQHEAYSTVLNESQVWSLTEMFYLCDRDGAALDDPNTIASEPLVLASAAHKTETGWYLTFDGLTMRGIKLSG